MTAPKRLRCAVVGTGTFAEICHIPGLQSHPQAEVVAICGGAERARRLAEQFGVTDIHTDVAELCARTDIDAVSIVSRNVDHKHQTITALRNGKHVMCEKPLAMNPSEARDMAAAAEASGRVHHVAFVFRYNYGVQELRRRVLNGDIGEPYLCRVQYDNWDGLKSDVAGWGDRKEFAGAGVLFNLGSHLFDLARYVIGPIRATTGFTHCVRRTGVDPQTGARVAVETDDLFSAWTEHASGARGQLFVSRASPSFTQNGQFEVVGPDGALKAGLSRGAFESLRLSTPTAPEWVDLPLPAAALDRKPHSLQLMMHSFVDACLRGASDPTLDGTFVDGLAAQEAMAGVLDGEASRRWIDTHNG